MKKFVPVLLVLGLLLSGCQVQSNANKASQSETTNTTSQQVQSTQSSSPAANQATSDGQQLAQVPFDIAKYPEYFMPVNNNDPVFVGAFKATVAAAQQKGEILPQVNYSGLDGLGRTQMVTAIVTEQMVTAHSSRVTKRPAFPAATKIAGEFADGQYNTVTHQWHGQVRNNKIMQLPGYRGYIYNKSHLLAWSLGGDMLTHNVILGTRAQNVGSNQQKDPGGMAYSETVTRDYLAAHPDDAVAYQAIPIYAGTELVPRGVWVIAQAIKQPQALNVNVWTFNTQLGASINYQTGAVH
ncbi:DNA/RNA non-specific endonuclease [Lacticaseibacillus brantae]|uniref:Type VII secretion system protein EssD-like domain-containing protein n=1 Tax=Lacticaseibacillus brantae DSM 23927 TaxID=1423727 RepID=A0A0R2B790_9LACO|nr:DNA/RNA non-specific endonuclease [Lacticaseibacillus brantae]KRM71974.1 hypothetical protein FC34_GL000955 [Lacticaseibacillus brantae DSM 23927]